MIEEKLYYTIKDIAEFTGENPSTLRYWETEFPELRPRRTAKGRRQYTPQDLETIRKIQFLLRTKGMHISAAQEQLQKNNKNISKKAETLQLLTEIKEELQQMLQSLNKRSN